MKGAWKLFVGFLLSIVWLQGHAAPFVADPYLQLGYDDPNAFTLMWLAREEEGTWSAQVKQWIPVKPGTPPFAPPAVGPDAQNPFAPGWLTLPGLKFVLAPSPRVRIYSAPMTALKPGVLYEYRVIKDKAVVFIGKFKTYDPATTKYRAAIFGDAGSGSHQQRVLASMLAKKNLDFTVIPGDIVYQRGLASEYLKRFFPVYNSAKYTRMMSVIPFIAAPGNHDTAYADFQAYPDSMAYYLYWQQPLNGPALQAGVNAPKLPDLPTAKNFATAAKASFPRMDNFSYDWGNSHWTVLDSNSFVNWKTPALRAWLEKDLASAAGKSWKFVVFHHPPYHTSSVHAEDKQMQVVCDLFEKYQVDIVFAGHVHNYQRSFPLKNAVGGKPIIDTKFDGVKVTKPNGVVYIVTGCGGAELYTQTVGPDGKLYQPFNARFGLRHSATLLDIDKKNLKLSQVDLNGVVIDQIAIKK